MTKIQYNVVERDTKNASGKAKKDVALILKQHGFKNMYKPSKKRWVRILQQLIGITRIKKNSILFVQYPANIDLCYRYLSRFKKIKKIAIIHDLESLRKTKTVQSELKTLSMFDIIISHNHKMTLYLKNIGLKNKIVNLNIFDYLLNNKPLTIQIHEKNIVAFAGNLEKAKFLFDLSKISGVKFNIYGVKVAGIDELEKKVNISYKGSYTSEVLIEKIEGGWGLVWDGDSLETCSGITGEYMKYNCPHKVSMCIVSERPIIIWSKAAMSDYVVKNKLGIKIDSLLELENKLKMVTDDEYQEMLDKIRVEKGRLTRGKSLSDILQHIDI